LLGVFDESHSTTITTELERGDVVVLYTDGITDVRPPHDLSPDDMKDMVGNAAADASTAEAVASNLGVFIDRKLPFAVRDDDIALLVLKMS
jgi:serine phosphatase RsbU (regulator of sigma subunit)